MRDPGEVAPGPQSAVAQSQSSYEPTIAAASGVAAGRASGVESHAERNIAAPNTIISFFMTTAFSFARRASMGNLLRGAARSGPCHHTLDSPSGQS